MTGREPTIDDVRAAARTIAGSIVRTPSAVSHTLSELTGATVILKFENLQFTASYKDRGAGNKLRHLTDAERSAGVVAVSAGNHGQAVARHAALLGIPATIVMPRTTPFVKLARTRHHGATVELVGDTVAEAMVRGRELEANGRTFVHPFDDPWVIAGQGTVALEMLEDHPEMDVVVAPVGGGGLLAGICAVVRGLGAHVELVGAQTHAFPSMALALAGDPEPVPGGATFAEGVAVSQAGALTSRMLAEAGAEIVLVTERAIEEAVNLLVEIEKVVAEGAGALPLAAMLDHPDRFQGRTVGLVLSGGNVDPRELASVLLRGLVHTGRLHRWRVRLEDRPGSLSRLTQVVGDEGGNIVEVNHERVFSDGPLRATEIELAVETMDRAHGERVLAALRDAGNRVAVVPLDPEP